MSLARRLAELERVASAGGREELDALSLEGTRLVERALRAGAEVLAVVCGEGYATSREPRVRDLLGALGEVERHVVPDAELRARTGGRSYGDVLALVRRPVQPALDELVGVRRAGFRPTLLVVHDADDPGNVGALVRTALATGALGVVATGLSDPHHPKAVRTSMGSLFRLPVLRRADPASLAEELRTLGVRSVGALSRGGLAPEALPGGDAPSALWLGSEAHGLPEELAARLDLGATIPMPAGVDSLSINAAAAILLHELAARSR